MRSSDRPFRAPRAVGSRLVTAALVLCAAALPAATIPVTTIDDLDLDDAECSLREAIEAANGDSAYHGCPAGAGADLVVFAFPTPATISLDSELPTITGSLTLAGPGAERVTIDGGSAVPLLEVDVPAASGLLRVHDLTLSRGFAPASGPVRGGAITVRGNDSLHLDRVIVRDNQSPRAGGGVLLAPQGGAAPTAMIERCLFVGNAVSFGSVGGGALLAGTGAHLLVDQTTFVGNSSWDPTGGGAVSVLGATAVVQRSTFSGNSAVGPGGAIVLASLGDDASLLITDSTITGNVADQIPPLGGPRLGGEAGNGGGIWVAGGVAEGLPNVELTLGNTLVAGNVDLGPVSHPDLSLAGAVTAVSLGFNLLGATEGTAGAWPVGLPNAAGDYVGTVADPVHPGLGAIGFHGGPTPVHLPIANPASFTVDHGQCVDAGGDQRGGVDPATGLRPLDHPTVPNSPDGDRCDIGAVELGAGPAPGASLFADGFESGTPYLWSASLLD